MMSKSAYSVALLVAASFAPQPAMSQEIADAASCACKDLITPTQMMDAYWARLNDPDNDMAQPDLGWRYLNLITMDGETIPESRLTTLALGEAAFLTFQPGVSRYYFEHAAEGDDLIARHAMDRIMQITFRAYDDKPAARDMFATFYDRFPPSILNTRGRNQQVRNFADWHFEQGRADEAIELILEELQRLPTDAPYLGFYLPVTYAEKISQSGEAERVFALAREKLAGLKSLQARDALHDGRDPILTSAMPRWYWSAQGFDPSETFEEGRKRQLDRLVAALEALLS